MRYQSPKHNFLAAGSSGEEQSYFESLIRIERTQYKPHHVMQRLHMSLARTRVNRGGLGSGKTRAMGEHLNALALTYPGALILIGRKDLTALKETTQKEFLEQVVVPETVERFNINENKLYYKNGSAVIFRETKEPDKVKSLQLTAYGLDESDENETPEIWEKLDDRLRQRIMMNGEWVTPPYAGILTFNPTDEDHWLYALAQRKDISVEDFQSSTYDNIENLPPDYIPNLLAKLPPWEVNRLVHGNWGRVVKGKPVLHGFTYEQNVRSLRINTGLPLIVGWDWGFNHPCASFMQIDPFSGRVGKMRELLGTKIYLPEFADQVVEVIHSLVGPNYPVFHYGDPHGADKKDTGQSSIEYLRLHKNIVVAYKRQEVKTGLDEIQHKIITKAKMYEDSDRQESLFLVDPSCRGSIAAYSGGYHRDEFGLPVKDGYYDHYVDTDRYPIVHMMGASLAARYKNRKRYVPRNKITGY